MNKETSEALLTTIRTILERNVESKLTPELATGIYMTISSVFSAVTEKDKDDDSNSVN